MSRNDEELLSHLHNPQKRASAFSTLVRMYQERLYWHIRKMLLSHDDTDDVLQNTFMKAWNGLESFRGEAQISTWLYRIATNETLTFLANKRLHNIQAVEDVEDALLETLHSGRYIDGNDVQMKLQRALLTLPEKQRIVFNMKYFEDMKYEEMEAILGTSIGALKASYHHAVKKIEKFLETED